MTGAVTGLYRGMLKLLRRPIVMKLIKPFIKKSTYAQMQTFIIPWPGSSRTPATAAKTTCIYDAPAALPFHTSPYAHAADAVITRTYAMPAAESLGLGTCMIGFLAPRWHTRLRSCASTTSPTAIKPAIVLILGYPAVKFQHAVRRAFHSVAYYERNF